MASRKSLSKKTRFEVFKRDSFKCQYCGRCAPDVILEVDHIIPVSEGGKNDLLNLITSCRDCNRGKGKRRLSNTSEIEKQKKQLDDLNQIREQTEMMIQWKRDLMKIEESQVNFIEDYVSDKIGCSFTDSGRSKIKALIRRFGFSEVYDSTVISFDTYEDLEYAFDKIGGICYNRKKQEEGMNYAE